MNPLLEFLARREFRMAAAFVVLLIIIRVVMYYVAKTF